MLRVLITGATGMLGSILVHRLKDKYNLFATGNSATPINPPKNYLSFDLKNKSYDDLMDWAKPEVVIHCAAITNVDYCEEFPDEAMEVNAESLEKILQWDSQIRIIFISTDAVFPENINLATEKDNPIPENIYGKSKFAGEKIIYETASSNLVIRTTIVGKSYNPSTKGFVDWIVESLNKGDKINLFYDVVFTPISIWHFANELEWILENEISGLIHVAGSKPISKYDFGIRISKKLGLNSSLIKKASLEDIVFKAKRSRDQTLDSTYYQSISGRLLPSINNTISVIAQYLK